MKLKKSDFTLLTIGLLFFGLSLWGFLKADGIYDFLFSETGDRGPSIGEMASSTSDVRRRLNSRFAWLPIQTKGPVFEGDSLYVGANSGASVKFLNQKAELQFAANTLTRLSSQAKDLYLSLAFGKIQAQGVKDQRLYIASGDGAENIEIKFESESMVELNSTAGDIQMLLAKGKATVKRGQISQELQLLRPTRIENQTGSIKLLQPEFGAYIEWTSKLKGIGFLWQENQDGSPGRRLEISTDPDFFENTASFEIANLQSAIDLPLKYFLPDQKYFWRLQSEDAKYSHTFQFNLLQKAPPQPLSPLNESEVPKGNSIENAVSLSWQAIRSGEDLVRERFLVEVSDDPSFSQPAIQQIISGATLATIPLDRPGKYYWRLKYLEPNPFSDMWSPVYAFYYGIPREARTGPEVTEDIQLNTNAKSIAVDKTIRFRWNEFTKITKNSVLISQNPNMESAKVIETDEDASANSSKSDTQNLELKISEPGPHYWQVRGLTDLGEIFVSKKIGFFEALHPPPEWTAVIPSDLDVEDKDRLRADVPLALEIKLWQQSSRLQIDATTSESGLKVFFCDSQPCEVLLPAGVNVVSTKWVQKGKWIQDGERPAHSKASPPQTLQLERRLKLGIPILTTPAEGLRVVLFASTPISIPFSWQRTPQAKSYTFELSKDSDFAKVIYQKNLKSRLLRIRLPPKSEGVFFWRVRGERENQLGGWSATRTVIVSNRNEPPAN